MNSIVIPTYCPTRGVEELLEKCIDLIESRTELPYELVIVENGSKTRIVDIAADVLVRTPEPLGYAKAVNLGISLAHGDHFLIVNNDIHVEEGWDRELVEAYANLPSKGGVLGAFDQQGGGREYWMDVSWWSCVCISRSSWSYVGELDAGALNYRLHDQDWSIRAKLAGLDVARWTGARVKHYEGSTYKHMKTDDIEIPERAEMRRRWGHEHFVDWLREEYPKIKGGKI